MAKLPDPDFWKRQFELPGNLPAAWFLSASDLLTAADVLDHFAGDIRGEIRETKMTRRRLERMSVVKISAMLRAMATECLLKALWLKHRGRLAEGGRIFAC